MFGVKVCARGNEVHRPRRARWTDFSVPLVALFVGCTPSPSSLCEHMIRLVEGQFGPIDRVDPERGRREAMRNCEQEQSTLRRRSPKAYACYADCVVDKRHLSDASECKTQCLPREPPQPASSGSESADLTPQAPP